jgi:RNA polymerase sigma-70 factor, ECF subfamily
MFKSLLKRMSPLTAADVEHPTSGANIHPDYASLVKRIIAGDAAAESELVAHFKDPVLHIVRRNAGNPSLVEDFSQDTFLTVIRKIRNGDLKQPESLGFFIAGVARNHTIEQMRLLRKRAGEDLEHAERLPDLSPNQLDKLETSKGLAEIRELIAELRPRYKELLLRYYINEEPKRAICTDLGLSSEQFDGVLHRARKRLKALYLKRKGLRQKGRRE